MLQWFSQDLVVVGALEGRGMGRGVRSWEGAVPSPQKIFGFLV